VGQNADEVRKKLFIGILCQHILSIDIPFILSGHLLCCGPERIVTRMQSLLSSKPIRTRKAWRWREKTYASSPSTSKTTDKKAYFYIMFISISLVSFTILILFVFGVVGRETLER